MKKETIFVSIGVVFIVKALLTLLLKIMVACDVDIIIQTIILIVGNFGLIAILCFIYVKLKQHIR